MIAESKTGLLARLRDALLTNMHAWQTHHVNLSIGFGGSPEKMFMPPP
jgi:hypothetical protein